MVPMPTDGTLLNAQGVLIALAAVFLIALSVTVSYDVPKGSRRIAERQRYIVWHQIRGGTAVGARHIWPALLPMGAFVLVIVLAPVVITAAGSPPGPVSIVLALVTFAFALAVFGFALVMAFRPPQRFLPRWWVIEEERRRAGLEPLIPPPSQGKHPTMTRRQRRLAAMFLVALVPVGIVLNLPAYAVMGGVSVGLVYLAAVRVGDKQVRADARPRAAGNPSRHIRAGNGSAPID
jgi:hypothetical protein